METYYPDEYYFSKDYKGKENIVIATLMEHICMICTDYTMLQSPASHSAVKRLNQDKSFELIKNVKEGHYRSLLLYKGDRVVMQLEGQGWNTLKLRLAREEFMNFREFLASRGYPRTLFLPSYDPAVANRKAVIAGAPKF